MIANKNKCVASEYRMFNVDSIENYEYSTLAVSKHLSFI